MTSDAQEYSLSAIRGLLLAAFTAETLRRFCQDRPAFRVVVDRFGTGHGLDDMVDEVIDYCETYLRFDELLTAVKLVNPRQYERFAGSLGAPAPRPPALDDEGVRLVRELHGQLVEIEASLRAWVYRDMPIGLSPPDVDAVEVVAQVRDLTLLARKARIYLSDDLRAAVVSAVEAVGATAQDLEARDMIPDGDEAWAAHERAVGRLPEIPTLIEKLEAEFRQIIDAR
jgi:hypothetical protein